MFQQLPTKVLRPRNLVALICARRVHLLHQIYSKYTNPHVGGLPFRPISDIELAPCRLASSTPGEEPSMATLSDLLDRIQPLQYLQFRLPAGAEDIRIEDASRYRYSIKEFQPIKRKEPVYCKRAGRSKEIHITTSLHPDAFKHRLRVAYGLVEEGRRLEFHLRAATKRKSFTVDWALRNLPYLRPDVMLRSMPEGTVVIVPPVENKKRQELIWAVSNSVGDQALMKSEEKKARKRRIAKQRAPEQEAPKKEPSVIPSFAAAVERSKRIEPRQWQGFRDDDEDSSRSDEDSSRSDEDSNGSDEATTGPFKIHRDPGRLVSRSSSSTKK